MATNDDLEFTWTTSFGDEGIDDDPINPFPRSLNVLLQEGKPIKKVGLALTHFPESVASPVRWIGTFVFSIADRLIFFPGFDFIPARIVAYKGQGLNVDKNVSIDHLTLEPDFKTWHATTQSGKHFGGPTTFELGEGRRLWLGMSIAIPEVLRPLKKRTLVKAEVASSDVARRTKIFETARSASSYPLTVPNPDTDLSSPAMFYHFSFIVGPVGFPDYEGQEHAYPTQAPFLEQHLPNAVRVPISAYRLSLAPHCDIQITMMKLPGQMTLPMGFTGPGQPQTL